MRDECLKLIGNNVSVKENVCNWEQHDGYWQSDCGIHLFRRWDANREQLVEHKVEV